MTRHSRTTGVKAGWAGLAAASLAFGVALAASQAAQARPGDLFYERMVLSAANGRCKLFNADMAFALEASTAQARGAALRNGRDEAELRQIDRLARARAQSTACDSPEMTAAAARAKDAFAAFAKYARMTYPGDVSGWSADRNAGKTIRWRLMQRPDLAGGDLIFGLTGRVGPSALMAVGQFENGAQPYAARLLIRDDRRTTGAYLMQRQGKATKDLPLERRIPPPAALKAYAATARSVAGEDLLPRGKAGWAFRFPAEAIAALAGLDPREAVIVELLMPGDSAKRAYVEVGDFAAGRAFLQIVQR